MPEHRSGLGRSRRRADLGLHLRRPAVEDLPARLRILQLEARRLSRRDHGLGSDRGRRQSGGDPARSFRDAALLRLQHGRLLEPLAVDGQARQAAAAHLSRELVPQGRERQIRLAGLRREHARAANGSSIACVAARRSPPKVRSASCRDTRTQLDRPRLSRAIASTKIMSVDTGEAKREALDQQELFDRFGSRLPSEMEEERHELLQRLKRAGRRKRSSHGE